MTILEISLIFRFCIFKEYQSFNPLQNLSSPQITCEDGLYGTATSYWPGAHKEMSSILADQ
jgi:hypothetical protein